MVRADNPATTLADLVGETVTNNGPGGSQIVWTMIAKEIHDLDLRYDGGDFNWVASGGDAIGLEWVLSGEVAATMCNYTSCADALANGLVKVLYDGRTAGQVYSEEVMGGAVAGSANLWHNTLVARKDWYDSHPNEVAFVLELFQRAMDAWNADPGAILIEYAADMGLDPEADAAVLEYLSTTAVDFDPVLDNIYLTEEAVAAERQIVASLQAVGIIPADFAGLEYGIVAPPCDTAPELSVCN